MNKEKTMTIINLDHISSNPLLPEVKDAMIEACLFGRLLAVLPKPAQDAVLGSTACCDQPLIGNGQNSHDDRLSLPSCC